MPANRNALVRYKTIDNCLRNRYRKWTLQDLVEACSEALYDYEGIDKGVSVRTVQMDIQLMRSDKLGYNAPIVVEEKKYYNYSDPNYSITNIPLSNQDLNKLTETVDFLKQFRGFSHFKELEDMVQKLEDQVSAQKTNRKPVIDFEKNENLKGLAYLDTLYQSIINKKAIRLTYQSFKARTANSFEFHPYLLKEFKNRWFVLGLKHKREGVLNLALDRIEQIEETNAPYMDINFDADKHFKNTIGVTVSPGLQSEKVVLFVINKHAPYIQTKPLHWTQKTIGKDNDGIIISLEVQLNFELEKEILGFGEGIIVLAPSRLKGNLEKRLQIATKQYETFLSEKTINELSMRLEKNGTHILDGIYTKKEVSVMGKLLNEYKTHHQQASDQIYALRNLMALIPELYGVLMNNKLKKVIYSFGNNYFLSKALYFDKPPKSNWYVTWHQDQTINVTKREDVEGYSGWTKKHDMYSVMPTENILKNTLTIRVHLDKTTSENGALQVLPGSQQRRLSDEEINTITANCRSQTCEVNSGGIHLMKPLLIHASSKTTNSKNRRVIHLEFCSLNLPTKLEWAEKEFITA